MFPLLLAVSLGSPPELPAAGPEPAVRYYLTLFAGQSVPFRARTAHTWATFAKVTTAPDGSSSAEPLTISWLPETTRVRPHWPIPEVGKNFSLAETFAIMGKNNSQVSMWGPYEISANRYELAVAQAGILESGQIRFRTFDNLGFRRTISHCVHAITHAEPTMQHRVQPVLRVGEPGTSHLAREYQRHGVFLGTQTHNELIPAIGADQYPVIPRQPGEWVRRKWR
jgi:hypothetical protein